MTVALDLFSRIGFSSRPYPLCGCAANGVSQSAPRHMTLAAFGSIKDNAEMTMLLLGWNREIRVQRYMYRGTCTEVK